jgi:hypothetical protein
MPDVVAKVEWPDEESVYIGLGYGVDLRAEVVSHGSGLSKNSRSERKECGIRDRGDNGLVNTAIELPW